MAASFTIAARNNGFSKADAREATTASVAAYREAMADFAQMGTLEVWYAHLDEDEHPGLGPPRRGDASTTAEGQDGTRGQGQAKADRALEKVAKNAEKNFAEGALPRQPAGAVEARRAGRRHVPDRQPAADRGPVAGAHRDVRHLRGGDRPDPPGPVPRLPRHAPGRPAAPAGALRGRRRGPQGGRRRQRRHPGLHRPAAGTRRARPAVPAGQGGDRVRPREVPAEEPLHAARRTGGAGPTDDAGRERHLPGLDRGAPRPTATSTGASCAT